ncbi:YodC family protein [Pantoea ananatis]|uniref:YodC family protein n=1 Tax=Pantoea ananas TaxID=553 RepID=UPI003FA41104
MEWAFNLQSLEHISKKRHIKNPYERRIYMSAKYKVGDIVQINSGGPEMTVQALPSVGTAGNYVCQWFAGKKLENGRFQEASLKPVTPSTATKPKPNDK